MKAAPNETAIRDLARALARMRTMAMGGGIPPSAEDLLRDAPPAEGYEGLARDVLQRLRLHCGRIICKRREILLGDVRSLSDGDAARLDMVMFQMQKDADQTYAAGFARARAALRRIRERRDRPEDAATLTQVSGLGRMTARAFRQAWENALGAYHPALVDRVIVADE